MGQILSYHVPAVQPWASHLTSLYLFAMSVEWDHNSRVPSGYEN